MTGSLPLFEFSFLIIETPKEVFRGCGGPSLGYIAHILKYRTVFPKHGTQPMILLFLIQLLVFFNEFGSNRTL